MTSDETSETAGTPPNTAGAAPTPAASPEGTTRRAALVGGAAAAGAALAAAMPHHVEAANGDPLRIGALNVGTESTELQFPSTSPGPRSHIFAVADGIWSTPRLPAAGNDPETGFRSTIFGWCGNQAMIGVGGITSAGVPGSAGGRFHGESPASYGLIASGRRATLRLATPDGGGTPTPPPDRADFHNTGEITIDDYADVWICVQAGNPGSWRKLAGPATAGQYHSITPARIFDSRLGHTPAAGRLRAGTDRVVDAHHARHVVTGDVTIADVVPPGATAVTYNLTVTGTAEAGFVFIAPGDASEITASSINWSTAGITIANGGTVKLDPERRLRLFCAGGSTEAIVDVTGYYR